MSLSRGIQSAIFFYLSCAPCTEAAHRKKRKKEAHDDRIARDELMQEQPGLYAHPSPSATNSYWDDEIVMGPGPPPQRLGKKGRNRALTGASTHDTLASRTDSNSSTGGLRSTVSDLAVHMTPVEEAIDWNDRRYQRCDSPVRDPPTPDNTSPKAAYFSVRHPRVNQHHPPASSAPSANQNETRWMLAPPAPVAVMAGSVPPRPRSSTTRSKTSTTGNRSRASTNRSRQSVRDFAPMPPAALLGGDLDREAFIQRKPSFNSSSLEKSSSRRSRPERQISLEPLQRTASDSSRLSPPQDSNKLASRSSNGSLASRSKRRPSPLAAATAQFPALTRSATDSNSRASSPGTSTPLDGMAKHLAPPFTGSGSPHGRRAENTKPRYSTPRGKVPYPLITSNGSDPFLSVSPYTRPKASTRSYSERVPHKDSSLNLLESTVDPRNLLGSNFVRSPVVEARVRLPAMSEDERRQLSADAVMSPRPQTPEDLDRERRDSATDDDDNETRMAWWAKEVLGLRQEKWFPGRWSMDMVRVSQDRTVMF